MSKNPQPIQSKILIALLHLGLLLTLGTQLFDIVGSNSSTKAIFGVSSITIAIVFSLLSFFFRYKSGSYLHKFFINILPLLFTITLVTGILLGIWGYLTPPNFVYSVTKINPDRVVFLSHFLGIVYLSSLRTTKLKRITRKYSYLLPFWIIGLSAWVQLLPFDSFTRFAHEDGPIETIQFFLILLTSLVWIRKAFTTSINKNKTVFILLALLSLFVAMEEISWGQRVFGIETPENLKVINVQDETTFHNIGIFNQLQTYGYIVIAIIGTLMPKFKRKYFINNTYFPVNLQSIFLSIPAIFYSLSLFTTSLFNWAEIIEVLFYSGLFVWAYNTKNSKSIN